MIPVRILSGADLGFADSDQGTMIPIAPGARQPPSCWSGNKTAVVAEEGRTMQKNVKDTLHAYDVVLGQRNKDRGSTGHTFLRRLLAENRVRYHTAKNKEKRLVAESIIQVVEQYGGSFLQRETTTDGKILYKRAAPRHLVLAMIQSSLNRLMPVLSLEQGEYFASPEMTQRVNIRETLHPYDVIVRKGGRPTSIHHSGNKFYEVLLAHNIPKYRVASKDEKCEIVHSIIDAIFRRGGNLVEESFIVGSGRPPSRGKMQYKELSNEKFVAKATRALSLRSKDRARREQASTTTTGTATSRRENHNTTAANLVATSAPSRELLISTRTTPVRRTHHHRWAENVTHRDSFISMSTASRCEDGNFSIQDDALVASSCEHGNFSSGNDTLVVGASIQNEIAESANSKKKLVPNTRPSERQQPESANSKKKLVPNTRPSERQQHSTLQPDSDVTTQHDFLLGEEVSAARRCLESTERTSSSLDYDDNMAARPSHLELPALATTMDPIEEGDPLPSSCPSGQESTCWDLACRYCCPGIRLEWLVVAAPVPPLSNEASPTTATDECATNNLEASCPSGQGTCWDFACRYCCPGIAEEYLTAAAIGAGNHKVLEKESCKSGATGAVPVPMATSLLSSIEEDIEKDSTARRRFEPPALKVVAPRAKRRADGPPPIGPAKELGNSTKRRTISSVQISPMATASNTTRNRGDSENAGDATIDRNGRWERSKYAHNSGAPPASSSWPQTSSSVVPSNHHDAYPWKYSSSSPWYPAKTAEAAAAKATTTTTHHRHHGRDLHDTTRRPSLYDKQPDLPRISRYHSSSSTTHHRPGSDYQYRRYYR